MITGGIVKSLARYEDRILEHAAEYGYVSYIRAQGANGRA